MPRDVTKYGKLVPYGIEYRRCHSQCGVVTPAEAVCWYLTEYQSSDTRSKSMPVRQLLKVIFSMWYYSHLSTTSI